MSLGERLAWVPLTPGKSVSVHSGVRVRPFVVDHSPPHGSCWGCTVDIERPEGAVRIFYSGDTRPTQDLLHHAEGADIVRHWCGGRDAHADRVHHVGHSTAGDAARLAATVRASQLVLFHLPSQDDAAKMRAEAEHHFSGRILVASDLDCIELT